MAIPWGELLNVGMQAGGAYLNYQNQQKKQDELERQYAAYQAAKAFQAQQSSGGGGGYSRGGGGGANRAATSAAYDKYNAMLKPYIDEANRALPMMSEMYGKGVKGFGGFTDQVLSPEHIQKVLTMDGPQEMKLPDYLMGGSNVPR